MNKITSALLVLLLFLLCLIPAHRAGSRTEGQEALLNGDQVIEALKRHGFELKREPRNPDPSYVFHRVINGVEPELYSLGGPQLLALYIFPSHQAMKEGRERFYQIPAAMVKHQAYEANNVLLFGVELEDGLTEKLEKVVQELNQK